MKATIIYDNQTEHKDLRADWGFSCLIETPDRTILFDTGADSEVLLSNMRALSISPAKVDEVVISHGHWDHAGGLQGFLRERAVPVYIPCSCTQVAGLDNAVMVRDSFSLCPGVHSTGELKGVEQSLVVETSQGLVIFTGCSHPGIETILQAASRYGIPSALVGGIHDSRNLDALKDLKYIYATHCTHYKKRIQSLYPGAYMSAGAGTVLNM